MENTFRSTENTFQSTETLSNQWKTLSSQRKIWFGFQESVFSFGCVCFPETIWKVVSGKSLSKLPCVCLPLEKLVNEKHFQVKRKIWLGFQESVFLENFGGKHFLKVVKILEMSLFADYIKFDHQTFDCYI